MKPTKFIAGVFDDPVLLLRAAKKAKDFAKADLIRKALLDQGVILEDQPGGLTEWRRD